MYLKLTTAHSEDRSRRRRTRAVNARPNGQYDRAVPRRRSTTLSPIHAIRRNADGPSRFRTWIPGAFVSPLRVVANGAGS
jgi:hypothetical protein